MALPVSFYSETVVDNTLKQNGEPESATWAVPIITLTAGNLVATNTLITNLQSAVNGIILGTNSKIETVSHRQTNTPGPSADPLCQRENKYLVRYHDSVTGQKFRASIPTADLTKKMTNSEFIDVTAGPGLAVKTAWEALVVSPNNSSNTTILDSIQFVGRNT